MSHTCRFSGTTFKIPIFKYMDRDSLHILSFQVVCGVGVWAFEQCALPQGGPRVICKIEKSCSDYLGRVSLVVREHPVL